MKWIGSLKFKDITFDIENNSKNEKTPYSIRIWGFKNKSY